MDYLIHYTAGTSSIVAELLPSAIPSARITWHDESAMLFTASGSVSPGMVPWVTNLFQVITRTRRKNLAGSIRQLGERAQCATFPPIRAKRGFRIAIQIDGTMTPIDPATRSAITRDIAARTGSRLETRGNCHEFWIIGRRNLPDLLLCSRLSASKAASVPAGALSPELAAMLVALSRPHKLDTFLDPFGGTGSIVLARSHGSARAITYADTRLHRHRPSFHRNLTTPGKVTLLAEDALALPSVPDGAISAIVTDPPWGEFVPLPLPATEFWPALAASFDRVLHPFHGRFVVLSSRRQAGPMAAALQRRGFLLDDPIDLLVNGHPASVVMGKRSRPDRPDR